MRLAVLADIHGNLPALEAVMAALEQLQPDHVILDGDMINPVPFSPGVVDLVKASDWIVVRGNHEFYLLDFGTERAPDGSDDPTRWGSLHWLVRQFSPTQINYLATLSDDRALFFPDTQPIRVAHGVPGRNRVGFYQEMGAPQILQEIKDIPERTLISAHTHVQVDRHVSIVQRMDPFSDPHDDGSQDRGYVDGFAQDRQDPNAHWHLINPGSVGLPLNQNPKAQFAIIESVPEGEEPGGWQVTHHQIDYDRRPSLEAFHTSGLLEEGGAIARLFYWELITAEPEIIHYFRWCRRMGQDPDTDMLQALAAYDAATGRSSYVKERDPLKGRLPV